MSCGTPPLSGPLTPPFTYTNWGVSNPGTPSAFITIDSNDHFGNGLFDDNTTATASLLGSSITFAPCGSTPPSVSLVSRNRITLAIPGIITSCDVTVGIIDTWTGPDPQYYKCGVPSGPPPSNVGAYIQTDFPAESTVVAGCLVTAILP